MSDSAIGGGGEAAPLRDAATVVLVRDTAADGAGLEVFLQRRVKQMAFAGGMTVFPGGGVDPRDADATVAWTGPEPDWWGSRFRVDTATAQALVCAAVRETFEECGVLLATDPDGAFADPGALDADRQRLVDKSLSLAEFLRAHGLTLRADLLRPLANWITPATEPRRYDTRFFVAALPAGQEADDRTTEAEIAGWASPADALAMFSEGRLFLLPPTWAQLRDLTAYSSVGELLAADRDIVPIAPEAGVGAGLAALRFDGVDEYLAAVPDGARPE